MRRHHLFIPDELFARAKACAAKMEISLAEFVRRAIESFLLKDEK